MAEDVSKSNPNTEPQLSDDIPTLEAEIAQITLEREKAIQKAQELRAAEDPVKRISYHQEIHDLQQDKLRMDVDIKFREVKINRIRKGVSENRGGEEPSDGFLF